MPKEMPKDGLSPKTSILYDYLMNCSRPEKELKEKMKTLETRTAILNEGAELVMEKKVEYEVKNVEAGGTGVTIHKK